MAKVLCAISGIEYNCDFMQVYLTSRESHHPIFDIPTSKLLEITPRWLDGDLNHIENYLLYLALFRSTGFMEFRVPATICAETPSIVAQNMHVLASIVEVITRNRSAIEAGRFILPSFVITPDTKDLSSSADWIKIWQNAYREYQDGYRTATLLERIERQETALERLIKDRTKDISSYASKLANWASDAGQFDKYADYDVLNEHNAIERMADYWKRIIVACAKGEAIWNFPEVDINDLVEHCEEHIFHGSIYAHTLMALLKRGAEKKKNYLDLGDIDLSNNSDGTTFRILDANASIEDANKLALIDSAPTEEPKRNDYPDGSAGQLMFVRAKLKYRMAQEYKQQQEVAKIIADSTVVKNRRSTDADEGEL